MLTRGGEAVKVSKRTGKSITLSNLLDEVPIDAARFFFNMREPNIHLEFDLELAVSQNSQNPVYYVEYAHARICSILRDLGETGTPKTTTNLEPSEKALLMCVAEFPEIVADAAKRYDPSKITKYLMNLAMLFHKFYTECRVKNEDKEIENLRAAILRSAKTTIKNALALLKIDAPEQM